MPFRVRADAKKWFKDIEKSFAVDFDIYYFCLIAGLATGRKEEIHGAEATDLIDYFPADYRPRGPIIVSLLLSRELKSMGIKLTERTAIHAAIQALVDPRAPSMLSDAGMKEMNKYSFGGFDVLTEWFDDRPRAIETFLPLFKQRLDSTLPQLHER